jgi:hypothetical protein
MSREGAASERPETLRRKKLKKALDDLRMFLYLSQKRRRSNQIAREN